MALGRSHRRWGRVRGLALLAALALAAGATAAQAKIVKHRVASFDQPTFATVAPGVRGKLYVAERAGRVRILSRGHVRSRPFLDISGRTTTNGERGFLSIAFDPAYRRNHLLYAYYTNPDGNIEIDEFRAATNLRVQAGSRRKVLEIPHPGASNHNGGTIAFGPGGYLFAATGDGGTGGANAQDRTSLLGKLLRIDPHRRGGHPYTVPRSNPFVGRPGRDAIFSMGLRNPFRFSFDGRRIAIADVGENSFEEVDYLRLRRARGANFGWPLYEGRHHVSGSRPARYRPPIFQYAHTGSNCESFGGCAITGGLVVHGGSLPSLRGRYLYADFYKGQVRSFVPHFDRASGDRSTGVHVPNPVDFARGRRGKVFVVSLAGGLYRLAQR